MKGKLRTPLWLVCDVSACLRLRVALGILAMAVRRFLPRSATKPPSPEGIVWLSAWQTGCESLLRWVIARQAFRLCGLDPRRCGSFPIGEARTSLAWYARHRAMLRMYANMSAIARRWAKRIRDCGDDHFRIPNPNPSNPSNLRVPDPTNPDPTNFRIPDFPVAIRGPPRLAHAADCRLPIASWPTPARPRAHVRLVQFANTTHALRYAANVSHAR